MDAHSIPLLARAAQYGDRLALVAEDGQLSYAQLLERSAQAATRLLQARSAANGAAPHPAGLDGARIAFLAPAGLAYAQTTWAIWQAGGVAVPLCTLHPEPELRHVVTDADASLLVAHPAFQERLAPLAESLGLPLLTTTALLAREPVAGPPLPKVSGAAGALILYTSGTTGKPKGVLTTHEILAAQLSSVTRAWEYAPEDRSLLVLPLHHLHGILNILWGTLWAGGVCEMHAQFSAQEVWDRITAQDGLTLFMAVPTIYAKLTMAYRAASPAEQSAMTAGCQALRLMVCGSAALPTTTLNAWREISGHTLLERYGMTEIGMALGNPLHGERRPGHVGTPFPNVEVRIADAQDSPLPEGEIGQIQVRGPNVFHSYFRRPQDTATSFTTDGFFRTGDMAVCEGGVYRILGRASVDILKTGGYKVSALEIEASLREHGDIVDCAVVGLPDPEWGQRVAAAVILSPGSTLDLQRLRDFAKTRLATYKVPTRLLQVDELPRNAMGKVQKPAVAALFEETS